MIYVIYKVNRDTGWGSVLNRVGQYSINVTDMECIGGAFHQYSDAVNYLQNENLYWHEDFVIMEFPLIQGKWGD